MTITAWLTLALAFMAFMQALGTWQNAREVKHRRLIAEQQLKLDREKFEYHKQLNENNHSGRVEAEDDVSWMRNDL